MKVRYSEAQIRRSVSQMMSSVAERGQGTGHALEARTVVRLAPKTPAPRLALVERKG